MRWSHRVIITKSSLTRCEVKISLVIFTYAAAISVNDRSPWISIGTTLARVICDDRDDVPMIGLPRLLFGLPTVGLPDFSNISSNYTFRVVASVLTVNTRVEVNTFDKLLLNLEIFTRDIGAFLLLVAETTPLRAFFIAR